nr:nucleoprotein TPR [Fagopyrum tataricum]
MDLLFRNIRNQLAAVCIENLPDTEEAPYISKFLSGDVDSIARIQFDSDKVEADEAVDVSSYVQRIVKSYRARHESLVQKFDLLSNLDDGFNSAVLEEVRGTMDRMIHMIDRADSLKKEISNLETDKLTLKNEIVALKDDVTVLESACSDATKELEADFGKHKLEAASFSNHLVEIEQGIERNKHTIAAEKLLSATREVHNLLLQFKKSENEFASVIEEMQDELSERRVTEEKTNTELSLNKSKISKLETDLKTTQDAHNDLIFKLEEFQTSEANLGNKEAEISSLRNTLLMKEQEVAATLHWVSQVKAVLEKTNKSEISTAETEGGSLEVQDSDYLKKLHYIMDNLSDLQHENKVLSHQKEELESSADAQLREIEYLKKLCEKDGKNEHELERVKSEFYDLVAGVGVVIEKLGGKAFIRDTDVVPTSELVETLEKLVMSLIMESDNSKTRVQELSAELLANQEGVDELLLKVKVLEDSLQGRAGPSEVIQERSIFEAPSPPPASEISEIEEVATVAKASISPVPSAAHVRTMRKGLSNDHIALDIAAERLISHEGTDDDKGHVFKSLNASGLIPKQGKIVADRVDGIWVSAGRVLMSRPRARLSLIGYWLLLHLWILGTIL